LNEVIRAADELQTYCDGRGWGNCIIGALALQRWGEPRETADVDLTLLTGFGNEVPFIDGLLSRFEPRIEDAAHFALQHRVLLLQAASGVGLDIALGGLPFEQSAIRRATAFLYPGGVSLRTCSAEDLVVMKAFATRAKDWMDIEGILIRNGRSLEWHYILDHLTPLVELKDAPEILEHLKKLRLDLSC